MRLQGEWFVYVSFTGIVIVDVVSGLQLCVLNSGCDLNYTGGWFGSWFGSRSGRQTRRLPWNGIMTHWISFTLLSRSRVHVFLLFGNRITGLRSWD